MSKSLVSLGRSRTKGILNRGTQVHTSIKKYSRVKCSKSYNIGDNMSGGHFRHFQSTLKKESDLLKEEIRRNEPEFTDDTVDSLEYIQFIMDITTSLLDEADWLYSGNITEKSFGDGVHNLRKQIISYRGSNERGNL